MMIRLHHLYDGCLENRRPTTTHQRWNKKQRQASALIQNPKGEMTYTVPFPHKQCILFGRAESRLVQSVELQPPPILPRQLS